MANSSQKTQDATQQALDAIDAALRVGDADRRQSPNREAPDSVQDDTSGLFKDEPKSPEWASDTTPLHPANDDRAAIGHILQALRRKPSRTPYIVAATAAAVWIAGGAATAFLYRGELQAMFATPRAGIAATKAHVGDPA